MPEPQRRGTVTVQAPTLESLNLHLQFVPGGLLLARGPALRCYCWCPGYSPGNKAQRRQATLSHKGS